jgi:Protein of unknown function (DUF4013)
MQRGTRSSDGAWWWDGQAWQPVGPPPLTAQPAGMFWFFQAPGWAGTFLLMGLIQIIPIVGQIELYGWYLATRDNLRQGWRVLPPAGFQHLERGLRPFVAGLIYLLYLLPVWVVAAVALVLAIRAENGALIALVFFLLAVVWLGVILIGGFLAAAFYDVADARGIGAAANPRNLWIAANSDTRTSWRVWGALLLGAVILFAASAVLLPILIFIPFGGVLINLLAPTPFLMAAPAQAQFNGSEALPAVPATPLTARPPGT